jgi:hypothetical protein
MATFTDFANHEWQVVITCDTEIQLSRRLDVHLSDCIATKFESVATWISKSIDFVPILFITVERQIDKLGLSERDFAERLLGDVLEQAKNAWLDALCDFFSDPIARKLCREVVTKSRQLTSMNRQVIDKQIDAEIASLSLDELSKELCGLGVSESSN